MEAVLILTLPVEPSDVPPDPLPDAVAEPSEPDAKLPPVAPEPSSRVSALVTKLEFYAAPRILAINTSSPDIVPSPDSELLKARTSSLVGT